LVFITADYDSFCYHIQCLLKLFRIVKCTRWKGRKLY